MKIPSFVWKSNFKPSRISHVLFRKAFRADGKIGDAFIHISATTRYRLSVNGVFVGCGPARAYPEFPEYDGHDISALLRKGENVIAVDVCHFGETCFHYLKSGPGFAAWGSVKCGKGRRISLSTASGWKCIESESCDRDAPAFSFAVGPIQIEDGRKAPEAWDMPGFDDSAWEKPGLVRNPHAAGLRQRSIPPMTSKEILADRIVSCNRNSDEERILSFKLVQEIRSRDEVKHPPAHSFARTKIFSPGEQEIEAGLWWGEHYLNGKLLGKSPCSDGRMLMERAKMRLKKGWNEFFVSYRMSYGIWEFHISFPAEKGLVFSRTQDRSDEGSFDVAGPVPAKKGDAILAKKPWVGGGVAGGLAKLWSGVHANALAVSPLRNLAWLGGRPIPLPKSAGMVVPAGEKRSIVFDFGRIVLGRIFIEYSAPPGTVFDFGYAEELSGNRPNYGKNFLVNAAERQIASRGKGRCETFFPRGFRYLEVLVDGHSGQVELKKAGVIEERYPLERRGNFRCSDEFFNTLWEYGWNTLELCSEDVITDCPWRERTLYAGDLLPETGTMLVASGDMRLVRRSIEILLQSQDEDGWMQSRAPNPRAEPTLYEYPVIALVNLDWYCRVSKDANFARRAYPVFRRLLDRILSKRGPGGLLESSYPAFIEHHYKAGDGCVCAFNALMVEALRSWSRILMMIGMEPEAEKAKIESGRLAKAIESGFWDERRDCLADNILKGGISKLSRNAAANSWALLFSDLDGRKKKAAMSKVVEIIRGFSPEKEFETVSPYGAFYLLGALYKHGIEDEAERCMKAIYRPMIENPTGTIWEHCNPTKSLTHAWSTAPNFYLSTRALGVRMGFPENEGLDSILIAPQSESLKWAEGMLPHPLGEVEVRWEIKGGELHLRYSCPKGIDVKVKPTGRLAKLKLVLEKR